jgi:hypothetical protein
MKLGTFSMSLPVFVVESDVTYQTVRSPTVFERMILRLCARYGNAPGIGDMTLFQVFEERLGVTSAGDCNSHIAAVRLILRRGSLSSSWRLRSL